MDIATATAIISTAASAVDLFDKVADQVVRFIRKTPEPPGPPKEFHYTVGKKEEALKVESGGQTIQVIRGEDLKNLPADYYGYIKTFEEYLQIHYSLWQQVYPHRNDSADILVSAKISNQLKDLALTMKKDLVGIINFLETIGVYLDDHYIIYRDVIKNYNGQEVKLERHA